MPPELHTSPPAPAPRRDGGLAPWPLLVAAAALALAGALLHATPADLQLFRALNALGEQAPALWSMLSVAGLGLSAFLGLAACLREAGPQAMRPMAALLWCFPVGGAFTHGLKRLIDHGRPAARLGVEQITVVGEPLLRGAMPSGHAVTTLAVVGLCLLAWRTRWSQRAALLGLALLVLVSRTAVGAHWPADLCVGAALGLLTAVLGWQGAARTGLADWLGGRTGQQVLGTAQVAGGAAMVALHSGYALALPLQWALGAWSVAAGLRRLARTGRLGPLAVAAGPLGVGSEPG